MTDGTFWMPYEELVKYFNELCILRCNDRFSYTYVRLPHLPPGSLAGVEVTFKRKTKGAFEMHQPHRRNYPGKTIATYKYFGIHFKVGAHA